MELKLLLIFNLYFISQKEINLFLFYKMKNIILSLVGIIIISYILYYLFTSKSGGGKNIGSGIYSGVAMYGRFQAVIGVIFGVIISIILVSVGISKLHDPHTAAAQMTITDVSGCSQNTVNTKKGTIINNLCNISVAFNASNGKRYTVSGVEVVWPTPLKIGMLVNLRYDPANPTSVVQEISPRALGWGLIGGGVILSAITIGIAILSFKSKGFAAVEGTASLANSFFGN